MFIKKRYGKYSLVLIINLVVILLIVISLILADTNEELILNNLSNDNNFVDIELNSEFLMNDNIFDIYNSINKGIQDNLYINHSQTQMIIFHEFIFRSLEKYVIYYANDELWGEIAGNEDQILLYDVSDNIRNLIYQNFTLIPNNTVSFANINFLPNIFFGGSTRGYSLSTNLNYIILPINKLEGTNTTSDQWGSIANYYIFPEYFHLSNSINAINKFTLEISSSIESLYELYGQSSVIFPKIIEIYTYKYDKINQVEDYFYVFIASLLLFQIVLMFLEDVRFKEKKELCELYYYRGMTFNQILLKYWLKMVVKPFSILISLVSIIYLYWEDQFEYLSIHNIIIPWYIVQIFGLSWIIIKNINQFKRSVQNNNIYSKKINVDQHIVITRIIVLFIFLNLIITIIELIEIRTQIASNIIISIPNYYVNLHWILILFILIVIIKSTKNRALHKIIDVRSLISVFGSKILYKTIILIFLLSSITFIGFSGVVRNEVFTQVYDQQNNNLIGEFDIKIGGPTIVLNNNYTQSLDEISGITNSFSYSKFPIDFEIDGGSRENTVTFTYQSEINKINCDCNLLDSKYFGDNIWLSEKYYNFYDDKTVIIENQSIPNHSFKLLQDNLGIDYNEENLIISSIENWERLGFSYLNYSGSPNFGYHIRIFVNDSSTPISDLKNKIVEKLNMFSHQIQITRLSSNSNEHPLKNFAEFNIENRVSLVFLGLTIALFNVLIFYNNSELTKNMEILRLKYSSNKIVMKILLYICLGLSLSLLVSAFLGIFSGLLYSIKLDFYFDLNYYPIINSLSYYFLPYLFASISYFYIFFKKLNTRE